MPSKNLASEMMDSLKKEGTIPKKVLFPRSEIGRETLAKGLRDIGSMVDEITAYSTESPADTSDLATKAYEEGVDFTTFTSSSTVKNLVDLMDGNPSLINTSKTVIIGPITAETARELGVNVDMQAEEQSTDGIVKAITAHLEQN
jgi:uroporphyrinogen III methyltransferase/synthase